jgi:roadblock/LC7 domain-containing protein
MSEPIEEHYAELEANTVVNVVVCDDPEYAAEMGWYTLAGLNPVPWIGWTYDGGQWSAP